MAEQAIPQKKLAREVSEWASKQKLLQLSEISLVLDCYDDIFSDFDPRTLDKRTLSEGFLMEIKRATKEKTSGIIELNFLIPLEQQKGEKEIMIKKRLHEYFKKHYEQTFREIKKIRGKGMTMIAIGLVLSILAAIFVSPNVQGNVLMNIALVLIEPAAWFTIWEGANKVFDTWKTLEPDLEFYKKMSKSEITFTAY